MVLGDNEELVQNNNYNGNDPRKMWALNPKIISTPTAKFLPEVIIVTGNRILVR